MDVVLLFPSFANVDAAIRLLQNWNVKNTTGRPFILCRKLKEVGEKIKKIVNLHPWIEVMPAHIMTPQRIFGSCNDIDSLEEVFGDVLSEIHAIETGLSADTKVLSLIPELDNLTFISNSDAHSAGLNVVGRESTVIEVDNFNYKKIVSVIRKNRVVFTIEFPPLEVKYFLTGHRKERSSHQGRPCYYSPQFSSSSRTCPICGKKLELGVLERAMELRKKQGSKRKFGELKDNAKPSICTVPLFDLLKTMGMGEKEYVAICQELGNKLNLWTADEGVTEKKLAALNLEERVIEAIKKIERGEFCFDPPGYDGVFGKLKIGKNRYLTSKGGSDGQRFKFILKRHDAPFCFTNNTSSSNDTCNSSGNNALS